MDMTELAKAFEEEPTKEVKQKSGNKPLPIITFLIGVVVLISGMLFLSNKLARQSAANDAEHLTEIGAFMKEGEDEVVWQFTEVGKGTLTTNNHINDYDFIWSIEGDTLKIETEWLYDLNNEYNYRIDGDKLILDDAIVFVPVED